MTALITRDWDLPRQQALGAQPAHRSAGIGTRQHPCVLVNLCDGAHAVSTEATPATEG